MNRRRLGAAYEEAAIQYLKEQKVRILEKNYRIRQGEIDIIAQDGDILVFCEVKYRKNTAYGYPWEAVSFAKQKKICQVARQYCYRKRLSVQIRYDVISICGGKIEWYKNAFDHIGEY